MKNRKSYSELIKLNTFEERLLYLKTYSTIGYKTFGNSRFLNQQLYRTKEWRSFRQKVILRDNGCDLGIEDRPIVKPDTITVHHINPITINDILERNPCVFDMENVICVSSNVTHKAVHYENKDFDDCPVVTERTKNDTCPWRK